MKNLLSVFLLIVFVTAGYFLYDGYFGHPKSQEPDLININTEIDTGKKDNSQQIKEEEKLRPIFTEKKLSLDELKCSGCNLVIISLTNTRKDHVGLYGYERNTTPNIDRFFQNSLLFENAFAPASWTLPVAVSFFSSLFPYTHGVMDRYDGSRIPDDILTLAEIFQQNGYRTAGFTGGGDYNRKFNFAQGFDVYIDEGGEIGPGSYFGVKESLPQAIDWLSGFNSENKFFLLIQGFDTHCPFEPKSQLERKFITDKESDLDFSTCLWTFEKTDPIYEGGNKYWLVKAWNNEKNEIEEIRLSDEEVDYMVALYDGKIAQADDRLKDFFQLVEKKSLGGNTIFIFMSEHGDLFGEHGRFMRGGPLHGTFYDPVINFPLLIKHPNIDDSIEINFLMQTVDLMPTLIDIFGIEDDQKDKRQGSSLINDFYGDKETNRYIYAASEYQSANSTFFEGFSSVEVVRNKEWKLIREEIKKSGEEKNKILELYKISYDPKEEDDIYKMEKRIVKELDANLNLWANSIKK